MTPSPYNRFHMLKDLLEPLQPRYTIRDIKPMSTFVVENFLYVSDQLSNSIRKYALEDTLKLVALYGCNKEGANWFANYDSVNGHVWMIGRDKNRLLLLDKDLHLKNELNTPDNTGFYFFHQGTNYLLSGFSASRKLFKVEGSTLVEQNVQVPLPLGRDFLMGHHVGQEIFFAYFDSKVIFRFSGGKFSRIAQLIDLPGRLYVIKHMEACRLYVVLTSKNKRAALYFYTKEFKPVQTVVLQDSIDPGTLACHGCDLYVGSYYAGRIDKYRLPIQAYAEGLQ